MTRSSLACSDCDSVRLGAFVLGGVIIFFLLAMMPTMAAAAADGGGEEYPMFHYDLQRTGNVSGDAPMTDDLLWSTDLGGFVESSPIVANGRVYASNWQMGVGSYGFYCLDERTGAIRWNNSLHGGDGGASTAALFGDDKLVVGSKSGYLYCINATSGETRWSKKIEHDPQFWGVASSPLVYEAEDLIFVTTFSNHSLNNGTLHAFDFDGTEVWSLSTGDTFYYTSPAIADGKVFFAGHLTTHSLFCVDIVSRTIAWRFNTSTQIKSTPAIWNDTIFFATADSMYAVNARTGGEVWCNPFSCVMSSPAVSNGKVYIGSEDDKKLYCYDGLTGEELWNYTVDGIIQSSPVVARETVFFGTSVFGTVGDGTIYAINATDESLRWSYDVDQCAMSSPAVADGILFVGADDGSVYAFGKNPAITTTVRIEGKNETIWYGDVTFSNSTIIDTDNVSHHHDKPTALGGVDAASKLGDFSYEVENQAEGLVVKSLHDEANNPETGDSWLYRVDYFSPTVSAADFIVGVTEPPSTPHREILWYYGSSATDPLDVTLEKTSVAVGEFFSVTVRYYNDTTSGWEPLDNATVHVGAVKYTTGGDGNAILSLSRAGTYAVYAEKEGFVRSVKRTVSVSLPLITVRIEGKNDTIWYGDVTLSNSTIVDTANVSHYFDKPTALGALDAASKLGNFSYKVVDMGWGLLVTSIGGEAYNPVTWDPSWLYRVDYYSPMVGAADFIVGVTEPPSVPHEGVLWHLGSFMAAPLTITLDKTNVTAGEPFNVTVTYYNDITSGWEPLDNATVHVGTMNYITGSDGNVTLSLSRAGSYTVYAEKEGFVRSVKRTVRVSLPLITVRIEGKNETIWYGDVIVGTSTIVDTANVSHYFDNPTALGALDAASKLGNFSYKAVDMGWGLMVTSIGGEAYDPVTWDPSWLYRVDYYSPMVGSAEFILNVTEPPSTPHKDVLWYLGSFTAAPLILTLDKTSVTVNEHFTITVESYNDISGLWDLVDNATVHVDGSNYTTDHNGSAVIALSKAGTYAIYAEREGCVRSEPKSITVTTPSDDDDDDISWWLDISVSLSKGSFNKTAFNTNKIFTIEYQTAFGALQRASELKGFEYTVEEWDFGPFVYSIADKQKYDEGGTSGWMYRVNGEDPPNVGAHDYPVDVGDEIIWYFSKNMETTPSTASRALRITIKQPSEGSGGTESTSSPTPAPAPTPAPEETKTIALIDAESNASVTFDRANVTRIIISANTTIRHASVMIQPLGEAVFAINVSGVPYCHFNVTTTNLTDTEIANATIEFKVNRTWINASNVDEATITLSRYHDNHWNALPTVKIGEDNTSLYFSAATQGFSVFAIAGERKTLPALVSSPSPTVSLPAPWATTEKTAAATRAPMPASAAMPQIPIPRQKESVVATAVSIVVLLVVLIAYFRRKREG